MSFDNYINREISWLSFNHRVLQEAKDPSVPLHEKIKFMAIFSNNLDEFFRVRVASLRNLLQLKNKGKKKLKFDPAVLLQEIHKTVNKQQCELGTIFREIIIKELLEYNIHLIDDENIPEGQLKYLKDYFKEEIQPYLQPVVLMHYGINIFLKNKSIYLVARLLRKDTRKKDTRKIKHGLVEIPTEHCGRFVELPKIDQNSYVMFIDDIIRYFLRDIFTGYDIDSSYEIKLTRDAELYIDDEFSGNLLAKIKKGVAKRKTGVPSRFLYDPDMPERDIKFLKKLFNLSKEDMVSGGRYHNFSDFMDFPQIGPQKLRYPKLTPLTAPEFPARRSILSVIRSRDVLLYYPYQMYNYVIKFLEEAIRSRHINSIYITLYRVSSDSLIVHRLIEAARSGIKVVAFVEVKARFDEELNFRWADEMISAGVQVIYSFPGLKVHAKILLIHSGSEKFAYLATGNFNEKTALIYTDFGLFTSNKKVTSELEYVFEYLSGERKDPEFKELLVAPFNMRERLNDLIEHEIKQAKKGRKAEIILKLNNLEDTKMIANFYRAADKGVKITIIVRSICRLDPLPGMHVFSIVDRYLEHSRLFIFHNGGRRKYYLASADWMQRNLARRIEVAFPIFDTAIKSRLDDFIRFQLQDNTKARLIDSTGKNEYRRDNQDQRLNAQMMSYSYLQKIAQDKR